MSLSPPRKRILSVCIGTHDYIFVFLVLATDVKNTGLCLIYNIPFPWPEQNEINKNMMDK